MKNYIKGIYKQTIFQSDNGYVIGTLKMKETTEQELQNYIDKTITFTGYFADLKLDDMYILYGEVVYHPKYGIQYQVSESVLVKPEDKDGIIAFLSSDLFPGIGEKMATKIVETLGEQTLDLILKEPECLNLVPKLSIKKQKQIFDILNQYEESHNTIVYLTELGFTMRDSLAIYHYYKENTIMEMEHNIYDIIDHVQEVTFPKVDKIAFKLDIQSTDERRIQAGLEYICKQISFETGDTYLELETIISAMKRYLNVELDETICLAHLDTLCVLEKLVNVDGHYYLKSIYDAENVICSRLSYLATQKEKNYKKIDSYLHALEEQMQIEYNDEQKKAIQMSLQQHVTIITGGPGTGKTTIIQAIVELYQILNGFEPSEAETHIALLAPTGRASKRMSEATIFPATTIHRFLKWNLDNNEFAVNEWNPASQQLIIVDEASMIDIELFGHLLKGLTKNIQLILVGDFNQLPSVGPGQVLKDLIKSNCIPTVKLERLYRQTKESYIPLLADEVKHNTLSQSFMEPKNDFLFIDCREEDILPAIQKLTQKLLETGYDQKKVQMMAPMYAGPVGIDALNKKLQQLWNPASTTKRELVVGDTIFREHDKVLQLVNMPEENVFNGDIGIIKYIIPAEQSKSKKNEIYVDYDGLEVKYLPQDFSKIKHGFIMSIHKSQGSEFDVVIIPMSTSYYRMLYRKLIYTGITRAKKKLILIGNPQAFLYGVSNDSERERATNLCQRMNFIMHNLDAM